MLRSIFSVTSIAIVLSGCVTHNNVPRGDNLALGADEGLVIVGAPEAARLVFHSGDIKDGKFTSDGWKLPEGIVGTADSGYFVRKLKATQDGRGYGMVSIHTDKHYAPNCGQKMAVLTVKPGQIQYFGDFSFVSNGSTVSIQYKSDIGAAQHYVADAYPRSTLPVVEGAVQSIEQGRCQTGGGTIYVPMYVPRKR